MQVKLKRQRLQHQVVEKQKNLYSSIINYQTNTTFLVTITPLGRERKWLTVLTSSSLSPCSVLLLSATFSLSRGRKLELSSFSLALDILQKHIDYTFQDISYLRRAMTHSSFSEENNKALSILGGNVIDTSVSMHSLGKDIDISSKDLNHRIAEISKVETSCAVDGMRLGLQKVVRVSPKTNASAPSVVCGAFRAIFGAIAIDTNKSDVAGICFWKVHNGGVGKLDNHCYVR